MQSTYSSAHGAGPGHAGAPVPTGPAPGLGLGLNMDDIDITNGHIPVDVFDQDLGFDESLLDPGSDIPPMPFVPAYELDNFNANAFEDPFSSFARPVYDAPTENASCHNNESPEQEDGGADNKLPEVLSFSAPVVNARVLDGNGVLAEANMTAELLGMFFVAEDVFGGDSTTTARPQQLTCYRRNLWQCSGQITLPRSTCQIINEQGQAYPVFELAASISAMESIEGKPTEIISIPWKSSGDESTKSPAAPPRVPLDLSAGQELDHSRVSLPVSWKRLQFKHATANNGRRKGHQQHYVVQINLLGKMENSDFLKIAEIQSGPVIVRGRSPRNFDSRKDVSVSTGDKKSERRATSTTSTPDAASLPVPKTEPGVDRQHPHRFNSLPEGAQQPEWLQSPSYAHTNPHPAKKTAPSPNLSRPPVPAWASDTSTGSTGSPAVAGPSATPRTSTLPRPGPSSTLPIVLSLFEDDHASPKRFQSDALSPRSAKNAGAGPQVQRTVDDDDEAQLYEYFPLSLDDWMAPVDAVYRPHVVHHTIVTPEQKAQQVQSKTKRYFSSD